jgi:hypothetical protein
MDPGGPRRARCSTKRSWGLAAHVVAFRLHDARHRCVIPVWGCCGGSAWRRLPKPGSGGRGVRILRTARATEDPGLLISLPRTGWGSTHASRHTKRGIRAPQQHVLAGEIGPTYPGDRLAASMVTRYPAQRLRPRRRQPRHLDRHRGARRRHRASRRDGGTRELPLRYAVLNIELAYASTAYRAQGETTRTAPWLSANTPVRHRPTSP